MRETTVDDPVFGKLIWDGFEHEGWAGSFVDAEYLSWGAVITQAFPDDKDAIEPAASETGAQDSLNQLLPVTGRKQGRDKTAKKMLKASRAFARRVDAYDGSLDADPLRKAGRLKVVVRNLQDTLPTSAQQAAWRDFRDGGDKLAKLIASALLAAYRQQRPERVRWWNIVYGDSPDRTLPNVTTARAMRAIVRPKEFRVHGEQNGVATVAVVFESLWCHEDLKVRVRNGKVIDVGPLEDSMGISTRPPPTEIESPVFGPLRRQDATGGWCGVFHSDVLRGYDQASQLRYRSRGSDSVRWASTSGTRLGHHHRRLHSPHFHRGGPTPDP